MNEVLFAVLIATAEAAAQTPPHKAPLRLPERRAGHWRAHVSSGSAGPDSFRR